MLRATSDSWCVSTVIGVPFAIMSRPCKTKHFVIGDRHKCKNMTIHC